MTKQQLAEKRALGAFREGDEAALTGNRWWGAFTAHLLALDADIEAGNDLSKYRLVEVDQFEAEVVQILDEWEKIPSENCRDLARRALRRGAEMAKEVGL